MNAPVPVGRAIMSAWPIAYSRDELRYFVSRYSWSNSELIRIEKWIFVCCFDSNTIMDGMDPEDRYFFQVPYDQLPLHMNSPSAMGRDVVRWRLDICK